MDEQRLSDKYDQYPLLLVTTDTKERGRASRRWQDDIVKKEGSTWGRKALDRRQGGGGRGALMDWGGGEEGGYKLQWMDSA